MKKTFDLFRSGRLIIWSVLFIVVAAGCRNDDDPNPAITNPANAKINDWIKVNMDFWYLWNSGLPANPDKNLPPDEFFESLLVDEDRFSWIQDNYQDLLNSLQGISKESGFEYVLYKESETSDNVIAQILYVKAESPAALAGLKRGDVITHINDRQMNVSNYQDVMAGIKENYTMRYKPLLSAENGTFDVEKQVSISPVEYAENPNYLSKVITVDDHRIGYYVYNFFSSGTTSNVTSYDAEMESIFNTFKAEGITDLVLDLRFNSGGSETAAKNLASLIGKGVDDTKVFMRKAYNPGVEEEILNTPDMGEEFLTAKFLLKSQNVGSLLNGGRVYILTSSRTASASELIINSLKPFMEVFLIGDVTYGKNVGSISLYDDEDATNKWGMQPIVVKVYNSLDQSDYGNGFIPDVKNEDNNLILYPLGDPREALLEQAIGQITGTASTGRKAPKGEQKEMIGHSLDDKRRSFRLVIDQDIPALIRPVK